MDKETVKPVIDEKSTTAPDLQPSSAVDSAPTDLAKVSDAKKTSTAPKKKKSKRSVPIAKVHILATFNNTIVTFSDSNGGALAASSAGACGFRGSKKGTAYAAQVAMEKAGQLAKQIYGVSKVSVYVKGVGLGRDAAIRALQSLDIYVETIIDVTTVAHGGVRPKKARRV